jgi:hypothetical protein
MEYLVTRLAHEDETNPSFIQDYINSYASKGWILHSTQFLPWAIEVGEGDDPQDFIGAGHLLLIFQRPRINS